MRKLLAGICLIAGVGGAAQNDKVVLKNGNKIEGKIIRYDVNDSISIKLSDSIKLTFASNELKGFRIGKDLHFIKKSGYYNNTSVGVPLGQTEYDYDVPLKMNINTINGYQINKQFKTGVGLGVDYFNEAFYFPITLNVSYTPFERMNSPFIRVYGGWAYPHIKKKDNNDWGWWGSYEYHYKGGRL